MDNLSFLLCSKALYLDSKNKKSAEPTVAFSTVKGSDNSRAQPFNLPRGRSYSRRGRDSRTQGSYRGYGYKGYGGSYRGSGSGRFRGQGSRVSNQFCQICGGSSHSALDCWHHMDPQFRSLFQSQSSQSSNFSSQSPSKAFVTASNASMSPSSSSAPSPWFLDSATTDHMTNDLSQLNC